LNYKQASFIFYNLLESQQHSVLDELKLFSERLGALGKLVEILEATPQNCHVEAIQKLPETKSQLLLLQAYIKTADSLNTGGSFEWVDSQIVTSLKCGQFILLEHVNLCSSAVLDRLNPVFEPNGSLLIAEKGISAQDSAEVVYKSTNFRAFLTVDPKNGELSRAMRNRCVELSLSRDNYSVDDMRAFVHEQGVHQTEAIDCILGIHKSISQLTEFNNYSISHLTQFAFLSAAYKRIGYHLKRAIYVAAMEVYVYSANTDLMGYGLSYYQNKLREVVLAQTEVFEEDATVQEDLLSDVVLSSGNLNSLTLISDLLHNPQTGYILASSPSSFQSAFKNFLLTLYERMQLVYYQRMRCDQDKMYIRNVFSTVFQCDAEELNQVSDDVALYWTADKVYLNDVVLEREQADVLDLVSRQEQSPLLLDSQRQLLKQIVEAVHMEKPILLCGSTDSGKTKLIDALCVYGVNI